MYFYFSQMGNAYAALVRNTEPTYDDVEEEYVEPTNTPKGRHPKTNKAVSMHLSELNNDCEHQYADVIDPNYMQMTHKHDYEHIDQNTMEYEHIYNNSTK